VQTKGFFTRSLLNQGEFLQERRKKGEEFWTERGLCSSGESAHFLQNQRQPLCDCNSYDKASRKEEGDQVQKKGDPDYKFTDKNADVLGGKAGS